jgi:DNA processing protein
VSTACPQCARRAWLLAKLSVRLDFRARELARFWRLLELPDRELIEAVGGRRRAELHAAYAEWEPTQAREGEKVTTLCRHHPAYPRSLREEPLAPHTLSVLGGVEHLTGMLDEKVVAIVGSRRASDYGMETARDLARGLAASGVTVASSLTDGIPSAVHAGALEARGATFTVMARSVECCSPAWCGALYRRIIASGCAISETPPGLRAPRCGESTCARTLVMLAQLVIVVEAADRPWELAGAHTAQKLGRAVAAVPGRVSSPASKGTNSLLMNGARLVRNPQDALDVLYGVGARIANDPVAGSATIEPQLARVLERVSSGEDTLEKLVARGSNSGDVAIALVELELRGLLVRGDGGRYVPSSGARLA